MPLVVSERTAAIGDLDGADKHARRQIAWMNARLLEFFCGTRFEAGINVNALANRRGSTAILKPFSTTQNLFCVRPTDAQCSHRQSQLELGLRLSDRFQRTNDLDCRRASRRW